MLFTNCGHLVPTDPTVVDLSPVTRNLEITLSNDHDVCPRCATPEEILWNLQGLLNLCKETQEHHSARLDAADTEEEKSAAERDKDSYDLDSKYVAGVMAGIQCNPIYHIIRENHHHNARYSWFWGKNQLGSICGFAIREHPPDDLAEEVDDYVEVTIHRLGSSWAFAQGRFLGQCWAELEGKKGSLVTLQAKLAATETHPPRTSCLRSVGPVWIVSKRSMLKKTCNRRLRDKNNMGKATI